MNFRRYILGQGLSQSGAWMQLTAELWLILEITGSGAAIGFHSVLRFGPVLLFGMQAGLLADRYDRLRLLIGTQTLQTVAAAVLAVTSSFGQPSLLLIYGVVLVQGMVNAVDNPLRRAFVRDLVTDEELPNAISLKSTSGTLAKTLGPALAGVLLTVWGATVCFGINTLSYMAVIAALLTIDRSKLRYAEPIARAPRQLRQGLQYAWASREVRALLILAAVVGVFVWNWSTVVPVYAKDTFGGDAAMYGLMLSSVGVGSFIGAVESARQTRVTRRRLVFTAAILSLGLLAGAIAPAPGLALIALFIVGAASTSFVIGLQSRLQIGLRDDMSGRVLGIYSVAFTGSKPIGGVMSGVLIDVASARMVFGVGAAAIAAATVWLSRFRFGPTRDKPADQS